MRFTPALAAVLLLLCLPAVASEPSAAITFNKDIAPIVLQNCAGCHREGQSGPFALLNYQDVKKRARQIAMVTQSRYMPPWHADSHGEFLDERRLTDDQIKQIQHWADAGMPEGKAANWPVPPTFTSEWTLGKPDLILEPDAAYTLDADGSDVYRCFVLPTHFDSDKYLSTMEVRPGNAKVVHHVIAYIDTTGKARQLDAADPGPGYTVHGGGIGFAPTGAIGGWAPGNMPRYLPDGVGTLLPKGADIVLQVHYHKSGKPETDRTQIGIYLCKGPIDKRVRVFPIAAPLHIPAGDADYAVHSMGFPVPEAATVIQVMPHMHLLGKSMTITATLPDGAQKTLIHVPDWDFNWQTTYAYKAPLQLPAGTKVSLVAHYDNSTTNPRNPNNPPRDVTWGEQTTDEMCIGFVWFTYDREHLTQGVRVADYLDRLLALAARRKADGSAPGRGKILKELFGALNGAKTQ